MLVLKNSFALLVSVAVLGPFCVVSAYAASVVASAVLLP